MVRIYADTYEVEENGTERKLAFHIVKVVKGRREVAEGERYQINYYDNDKVGEVKAVSEPGEKLILSPDNVSGLKLVCANSNSVTICFEKQSSVTGYEVVLYQGNKEKRRVIFGSKIYPKRG